MKYVVQKREYIDSHSKYTSIYLFSSYENTHTVHTHTYIHTHSLLADGEPWGRQGCKTSLFSLSTYAALCSVVALYQGVAETGSAQIYTGILEARF